MEFDQYRPQHTFCSSRCRMAHNNLAYNRRGTRAEKDARWYSKDGWYVQYVRRLERRIRQRLEEVGP